MCAGPRAGAARRSVRRRNTDPRRVISAAFPGCRYSIDKLSVVADDDTSLPDEALRVLADLPDVRSLAPRPTFGDAPRITRWDAAVDVDGVCTRGVSAHIPRMGKKPSGSSGAILSVKLGEGEA